MRKKCLDMVYELAKTDSRIVFVGSDLGHGTLAAFQKDFPTRFYMEGICEANIVGMSAGLALAGNIVYVNTIAPFFTRRALEQIIVDLCMHKAKVRLIGNGAGTVYAPLGPTHETLEDIAVMKAIPNMRIVAPADACEMEKLMPQTVNIDGPLYIRLGKGFDPIVTDVLPEPILGKPQQIGNGKDVLFLTTGVTLSRALDASELLRKENIESTILHCHTLKPFDKESLLKHGAKIKLIVSIEEHSCIGGLGSDVTDTLALNPPTPFPRIRKIGFADRFPQGYGTQDDHLIENGISADAIGRLVRRELAADA